MRAKVVVCLCLVLGVFVTLNSVAGAQEKSLIADYLVTEGKNYYVAGDYAKAIHELSKALLVDPNHEEAQYYLNKLGATASLLLGRRSSKISQLNQMARNVEVYKNELVKLERDNMKKTKLTELMQKEREKLNQILVSKEEENKGLKEKINNVQEHFHQKANEDRGKIKELEKIKEKQKKEIACLNDELCTLEETLLTKVELIEDQQTEIKSLNKNVQEVKKMAKQRAAEDRELIKGIERSSSQKSQEIAKLNTDLIDVQGRLSVTETNLSEKEKKINELGTEINSLEKELNTTESRWESTKSDYEKTIEKLESAVTQQKTLLSKSEEEYDSKMKRLKKALRERRSELDAKEKRLDAANMKLELTQRALEAKGKVITQLRKSLLALEQELVHIQASNKNEILAKKQKGQKISQDEQERMAFIKRQDQLIFDLKEKLAAARQEIRTMEKSAAQSDVRKLIDLKEQLTIVKLQLEESASASLQDSKQYDLLKDRLLDTEKRLDVLVRVSQEKDIQVKELEQQLSEVLTQANY